MGSEDSTGQLTTAARDRGESLYERLRETLLTGIAIIVPLVVTVYVLTIALDFVASAIAPFVTLLQWFGLIERFESVELIRLLIELGVYTLVIDFLTELIAVAIFVGVVLAVGSVGRHRYGEQIIELADLAISSIPGVGTVYKSFRRMGDVMLTEGAENFQAVKLVQCLGEDIYVLGFETNQSPATVEESAGHEEMVVVFLPMAPNPVTGGFLTYVPEDSVHDIDMTIEDGVRAILTSGIAAGGEADGMPVTTVSDLSMLDGVEQFGDSFVQGDREGGGGEADGDDGDGSTASPPE